MGKTHGTERVLRNEIREMKDQLAPIWKDRGYMSKELNTVKEVVMRDGN